MAAKLWMKYCNEVENDFKQTISKSYSCHKTSNDVLNSMLAGSGIYDRVCIPKLGVDVVRQVFWRFVSESEDGKKALFLNYRDFKPFALNFGLQVVGEDGVSTFVFPRSTISQTFGQKQFEKFQAVYERHKISPVYVDTSLEYNFRTYKYANRIPVFVKDVMQVTFDGQKMQLYHVVVPDKLRSLVALDMDIGLQIRGQEGWLPSKFLSSISSNNPFMYYKWVEGELNAFTFGFEKCQSKDGVMLWNVRGISLPNDPLLVETPKGHRLVSEMSYSQEQLDSGILLGRKAFFQTGVDGWMKCFIYKVISIAQREKLGWLPYNVRFDDGCTIAVQFQLNLWSTARNSTPGSWCLLDELVPAPNGMKSLPRLIHQISIDEGHLLKCLVMFKFEEGWFCGTVESCVKTNKRTKSVRPQQYVVCWTDDTKCTVWFDANKYCDLIDAAPASWCMLGFT